ncbi:hypothetical protein THIX_60839 [Thiomonas sp. X19]|uniref:Uncharacterized protein n=1 Tax=mine drainage metagenome TaxID=410659 RepID=E6PNI2_9ZZZZ|nr:hypothetical protein [Thiomonas sp. X19]SCC94781.1 hypothetical protein THIX_60839 [Thiomonas sp. X19]
MSASIPASATHSPKTSRPSADEALRKLDGADAVTDALLGKKKTSIAECFIEARRQDIQKLLDGGLSVARYAALLAPKLDMKPSTLQAALTKAGFVSLQAKAPGASQAANKSAPKTPPPAQPAPQSAAPSGLPSSTQPAQPQPITDADLRPILALLDFGQPGAPPTPSDRARVRGWVEKHGVAKTEALFQQWRAFNGPEVPAYPSSVHAIMR